MTDRVDGIYVALERTMREDDAQEIIDAIKMIRGVGPVTFMTDEPHKWAIRSQARAACAPTPSTTVRS